MTETLSASVSYAVSLYLKTVDELGPRAAYEAAVAAAQLNSPDRAKLRATLQALPVKR